MKIKELALINFSSHKASKVEFGKPVALVVGQLNAGKSSILQGIEYAMTGECGLHRKRTDNRNELVRNGENGLMQVSAVTDKGQATRTRDPQNNTESAGWNMTVHPTAAAMDAVVQASTGVSTTVLSSLLNTSGFFSLDDATQKEIIIGLIGAEITDAKVRGAWTGDEGALTILPNKIDSLKALEGSYDYCFKRRTNAKRELGDLRPPQPPEGEPPPLDRMREKIVSLEKVMQEAIVAKAKLQGAASAVSGRDRLEKEAADLDVEIAKPLPRPDNDIRAIQKLEQIIKEAAAGVEAMEVEVMELKVRLATTGKNIELLSAFNGRCVAGDHACPAPLADMMAAKHAQENGVLDIQRELTDAQERLTNVRQVREDRTEIRKHEDAIRECSRQTEFRLKQKARLEEIGRLLQKKDVVVNTAEIDKLSEEIKVLEGRIQNGRKQVDDAANWIERERQVKAVAEKRRVLEIEVRHLEELVDFLGAKGVRVKLIDEKISKFIDEIQSHLLRFGFTMELTVDPWAIRINGTPVKRLSASERYRLSVSFQVGIAKLSDLNFVICDGAEILTPAVFSTMMGLLSNAGLDQAIVIKTLMVPTETFLKTRPKVPTLEYFVVKNETGVSTVERLD